eukprot:TRINITY_DN11224_c0_g1_i1.p1 TRINITY_DN11224_c0_g1~~TRINITY_DN11224_c0_g1_i1.p1  ORF type:complete len:190 (+),score=73.25 TRINITY_DN11224_c0_g1_i1:26-595(+)
MLCPHPHPQDDAMKVYVLESNIMPSLATGSAMDKAVKNRLLSHIITMVGVVPYDRDAVAQEEACGTYDWTSRENSRTCTYINGKYPGAGKRGRDSKQFFDSLTDNDKRMLVEAEEELHRRGGFTRVFPTYKTWEQYAQYFDVTRYRNELLARWEAEKEAEHMRAMAADGATAVHTDIDWDVPVPKAPIQ